MEGDCCQLLRTCKHSHIPTPINQEATKERPCRETDHHDPAQSRKDFSTGSIRRNVRDVGIDGSEQGGNATERSVDDGPNDQEAVATWDKVREGSNKDERQVTGWSVTSLTDEKTDLQNSPNSAMAMTRVRPILSDCCPQKPVVRAASIPIVRVIT